MEFTDSLRLDKTPRTEPEELWNTSKPELKAEPTSRAMGEAHCIARFAESLTECDNPAGYRRAPSATPAGQGGRNGQTAVTARYERCGHWETPRPLLRARPVDNL